MQDHRLAIWPRRPKGRRQGGRGVDDHEIAGLELRRQVAQRPVPDAGVRRGDHQPHVVAGPAVGLGRVVRLEPGRQLELQRIGVDDLEGAHSDPASASASARAS